MIRVAGALVLVLLCSLATAGKTDSVQVLRSYAGWTLYCDTEVPTSCSIVSAYQSVNDPRQWVRTAVYYGDKDGDTDLWMLFRIPPEASAGRTIHLRGIDAAGARVFDGIRQIETCIAERCEVHWRLTGDARHRLLLSKFVAISYKVSADKGVGFDLPIAELPQALATLETLVRK